MKNKLNIGFIEDTPLHGGTQIWVTEAAKVFLSKGYDVTVLAPENSWVFNECSKLNAVVIGYDYDKVTEENSKDEENWRRALERMSVAICTVHPPRKGFHCSVYAAGVIKKFDLDTVLLPKTGTIVPEYKREFYLPDPDIRSHVITITDFTRKYIIENYKIPETGVSLIYQGTDISSFNVDKDVISESRRRYPLPEDSYPVIGNVGSFEERKGQIVLLKAFKRILSEFPESTLMFVGDGPDEKLLKDTVKDFKIEKNVIFFPFTREPSFVYARIDILVLSSLYKEGLPNVLLESLAMKVPVIASDIAGIPEIVITGETGYLVEPGNVEQLSDSIIKMASDKDNMYEMGKNGREFIESNFNKNRQFDRFLQFFLDITK